MNIRSPVNYFLDINYSNKMVGEPVLMHIPLPSRQTKLESQQQHQQHQQQKHQQHQHQQHQQQQPGRRSRSESRTGLLSSRLESQVERERKVKIERENQLLLKKILDCHHGVDRRRTSSIPPPPSKAPRAPRGRRCFSPIKTSNQVNEARRREKSDYENLILLQKIQNVKPSRLVQKSFQ
ncbi:GATA zinc finger domain-containing protein 10 [Eurytemora carolleeae]|uniref:GATA zinc finger domain-containing protein 10 n=1 Tax=Eurytemora carolleeae TaxID=1294199 RepID=UPI000C763201|nr:GATA zinc finger domain-containing protein 10 [Eurytemora carolleeae]|eukprot:XP_023342655.1 GATA zinc finger domain-containing protein 10-like [Eurytemora affinis]